MLALAALGPIPLGAERLQQDVDADHAGPEERLGIEDGAIDVRLGREVDRRVRLVDERRHGLRVGDVADDERKAGGHLGVVLDRAQVRAIARRT